jgi:DNA-binding transcriptional MerR regulator
MEENVMKYHASKTLQQLGVSRSRLRYWEQKGLLKPVRRQNSRDWRRYSDDDVLTIKRMLHLLRLGLTLDGAVRNLPKLIDIEAKAAAIKVAAAGLNQR